MLGSLGTEDYVPSCGSVNHNISNTHLIFQGRSDGSVSVLGLIMVLDEVLFRGCFKLLAIKVIVPTSIGLG